jgi:hypothetical protein
MKIIYLVAAHYGASHYGELLEALGPSLVVTHVDRKTEPKPFSDAAEGFQNVLFVPDQSRVDVLWGGWSQVAATLAMLDIARPHISPDDYVVLLSGDSYPLRDAASLKTHLESWPNVQYINTVPMPSREMSKPLSRITRDYLEYDPNSGSKSWARRIYNKIGVRRQYRSSFAGSTWWALTGSAILSILDDVKQDHAFVQFCRRTRMPDEFFFQTLLAASPYGGDVLPSFMYADWSRPTGPKPAVLDADHVDLLVANSLRMEGGYGAAVALFARKVRNSEISEQIRSKIWPIPNPE